MCYLTFVNDFLCFTARGGFALRGTLTMSKDIFGSYSSGEVGWRGHVHWYLVDRNYSTFWDSQDNPYNNDYPAQIISSTGVQKPWPNGIV